MTTRTASRAAWTQCTSSRRWTAATAIHCTRTSRIRGWVSTASSTSASTPD
ncbi:conserved hypothetical protein [Ricinus communis]|uniref:Uncharacterized protein n=1 Tax=Ricinus communis TaxID=3988 RepID=B9TDP6_RICCO|nr:conserved hypothetical protein [Ricinus communis]